MGAVFVRHGIYDTVVNSTPAGIELFHGYTYSGHPLAAAAGIATLELYETERLFERAGSLASYWEDALHSLRGLPNVIDIRNLGLVGGVELEPRAGTPGARAYDVFVDCFNRGALIRVTGDIIALSPPLIIEKKQIDDLVGLVGDAIKRVS
jgi:beta-alanine--pyruvate transaminase